MAIIMYTGNVGSGKTLSAVKEIYQKSGKKIFSNIKTHGLKNNTLINGSMIVKKEFVRNIQRKNGKIEPEFKLSLNVDFWKKQAKKEPIDIYVDEAHTLLNSRRAMSKPNVLATDWIALIRRVLGSSSRGNLILISQLSRRIDPIVRDMAHSIKYHVCYYVKSCRKCLSYWGESSECPEPADQCPKCQSYNLFEKNHIVEVLCFQGIDKFERWKEYGSRLYYRRYIITDAPDYFNKYNTLQWENMFSDLY